MKMSQRSVTVRRMKTMQIKFDDNEKFSVPVLATLERPAAPQFQFRHGPEHLRGGSAIFLISLRQNHKVRSRRSRVTFTAVAA